jgi:ferrous iron transport protein A
MEIPLSQLEYRKTAKVKYLTGGFGLQRKILALGIRVGKNVRVMSSHRFGGPVVIEVDNIRLAIGRGMANRIIVESNED